MRNFIQSLPPLPDSNEMRKWDANAIEFGLPENMLMENSGHALLNFVREKLAHLSGKKILIFMGAGNNGGDAACLARLLLAEQAFPLVLHLKDISDLRNSAAWHTHLALKDGVIFERINSQDITSNSLWEICGKKFDAAPDLIIDGLLGTGFKNSLREPLLSLIQAINNFIQWLKIPLLAIDTPSGLDCDLGKACPVAIKASWTVCLAAAKKGMVLSDARQYTGQLCARSIGMPESTIKPCKYRLVDGRIFLDNVQLPSNSYKNSYGHLLVIGGSKGLTGAPHLTALAALRCGAGLVSACSPASLAREVKGDVAEIMLISAGERDATDWPDNIDAHLASQISRMSALVIGPGMGRSENAKKFLKSLLALSGRPPAVIDADALFLLAQMPDILQHLTNQDIITPHPGEAAFLLNCSAKEIQQDRQQNLERLCSLSKAVVILKGANSLIGQKDQDILLAPYDIPQMAIGGSGDVLSGCVGASLASNGNQISSLEIAAKAVMRHLCAGLICAQKFSQRGILASELADALAQTETFILGLSRKNLLRGMQPWP